MPKDIKSSINLPHHGPSRSYNSRWNRSYPHSSQYIDSIPVRHPNFRNQAINDSEDFNYYSTTNHPPPLMGVAMPIREEPAKESSKSTVKNIMKTLATFLTQAKQDSDDLDLLRQALKGIVGENFQLPQDQLTSITKRIEVCEQQVPDSSTVERLNVLERRIGEEIAMMHRRIERLENRVFDGVPRDGTDLNTSDASNVQHKKKKWTEKPHEDKISSIFQTFAFSNSNTANEFLCGRSPNNGGNTTHSRLDQTRLANIERLTAENSLLKKRLETLQKSSPERGCPVGEKGCESSSLIVENVQVKEETHVEDPMRFILDSDDHVVVHIDGVGNMKTNKRARSGVRVWFGDSHALNVSRPVGSDTSNKSAQLQALYAALSQCSGAGLSKVRLYTNSDYILKCVNKLDKWSKQPGLSHADHFQSIYRLLQTLQADFRILKEENQARSMDLKEPRIKLEPT